MENDKTTSAVPTKEELQAFIQAHSYYYIPKWESFDPTLKRIAPGTFNWAACLLNVFWMAYRRMYLFVIILVAFEAVCFSILEIFFKLPTSITNAVGIATMMILGRYGNSLYRKHVERKIRQIKTKIAPEYQSQAFRDSGGTSLWAPIPLIILQLLTLYGMYLGIVQKNVKANTDANTRTVGLGSPDQIGSLPSVPNVPIVSSTSPVPALSFDDQLAARWSPSGQLKAEQEQVAAGLKVFDLSLSYEPDPVNGTNYVEFTTLRGRIKNDSSKNITSLTLKIIVFDSNTNQIDTIPVLVCGSLTGYNLLPQINSNEVKSFYVFARGGDRIPTGFSFNCVVDGDTLEFQP